MSKAVKEATVKDTYNAHDSGFMFRVAQGFHQVRVNFLPSIFDHIVHLQHAVGSPWVLDGAGPMEKSRFEVLLPVLHIKGASLSRERQVVLGVTDLLCTLLLTGHILHHSNLPYMDRHLHKSQMLTKRVSCVTHLAGFPLTSIIT